MAVDLNVLVVDDTVTYRHLLSKLVAEIEGIELAGTASNGKIALSKIELVPIDLVLLDMYMPVMDGLETLVNIKKSFPHVEVIMLSAFDKGNANLTMQALEKGALDFIPKPSGGSVDENITKLRNTLIPLISLVRTRKFARQARSIAGERKTSELQSSLIKPIKVPIAIKPIIKPTDSLKSVDSIKSLDTIKSLDAIKYLDTIKPFDSISEKSEDRSNIIIPKKRPIGPIDIVALGVSTGGPNALLKVIPLLPKDLPVAVVAVQHMPPMFTASLAERLDKISNISVFEGKEGQVIEKGCMYIAPGGIHMVVKKAPNGNILSMVDSAAVNSCKPAVDVLFRSVLMVYGMNILTVIMTGMGNDGTAGVSAIRRKGGYSIVQDEESSVVWGMPGSVVKSDNADEVVALDNIASRIQEIVMKGQAKC